MKPDLHRIQSFILIAFFCVMCIVCNGQVEELMPSDTSRVIEINPTTEFEEARMISVSEKDSTYKVAPTSTKTKSHTEPARPEKVKEESEEDDSILSFNFIYYIIRKFKLSDIIDH
jgi:hypothetical protein